MKMFNYQFITLNLLKIFNLLDIKNFIIKKKKQDEIARELALMQSRPNFLACSKYKTDQSNPHFMN